MITLPLKDLRPGYRIAQNIYNDKGLNYLVAGTALTPIYINRLRKLGFEAISVFTKEEESCISKDYLPTDIISKKTRLDAMRDVKKIFKDYEMKKTIDLTPINKSAENIMKDILKNSNNLICLSDIRQHDNYTYAHSVNVAVLAFLIGNMLNYSYNNLLTLIMGGLLHDVGKVTVPATILNKAGKLTDEEFNEIKKHPTNGRHIINQNNAYLLNQHLIELMVEQHHERINGKGYPHGLEGDNIAKFAKILSIADVYDALTSTRSYKVAYKPYVAYNIMKNLSVGQFDQNLLDIFFKGVTIYPNTIILKTSVGYGIVKKTLRGQTMRPIIVVFADNDMQLLPLPFMVDLFKDSWINIDDVIEEQKQITLTEKLGIDPINFLNEKYEFKKFTTADIPWIK